MLSNKTFTIDLSQFLFSTSRALDAVEQEVLGAAQNHSKRVAYLSVMLAKQLGLSYQEQIDLASYACLHDNALTEYITQQRRNGNTSLVHQLTDDFQFHCTVGEKNVHAFPFLTKEKNVITYHHENYDGSGIFGLRGSHIPIMARIIRIADNVDVSFCLSEYTDEKRNAVIRHLEENAGILYDNDFIAPFGKLFTSQTALALRDDTIENSLRQIVPPKEITMSYEEFIHICSTFAHIIDYKSPFTLNHSRGIAEKTKWMSQYYEFDEVTSNEIYISAFLHDIGKLAVPDSLLEKPGKLTAEEFKIVKSHVWYTHEILKVISQFHHIERWASSHHERLDGSGYFRGCSAKDMDTCSRLLACIDVYQALVEDRPYRKGMTHEQAMYILLQQSQGGKLDSKIVADIGKVFCDSKHLSVC